MDVKVFLLTIKYEEKKEKGELVIRVNERQTKKIHQTIPVSQLGHVCIKQFTGLPGTKRVWQS